MGSRGPESCQCADWSQDKDTHLDAPSVFVRMQWPFGPRAHVNKPVPLHRTKPPALPKLSRQTVPEEKHVS